MFSGCRKSWENQNTKPALKKLKTITSGSDSLVGEVISKTTTFDYTSDGKLLKVVVNISGKDSHIISTTYNYLKDSVKAEIVTSYYSNLELKKFNSTQVIKLNSYGFISISVSSGTGGDFIETFQYDKSGKCIIQREFPDNRYETNFKYSDGNMVSNSVTYGSQVLNEEMTYYLDKINTISPDNTWFYYFGNGNKNLMKTDHVFMPGSQGYTIGYTYEFDANNYVTKRTSTYDDGRVTWDKYTYQ